MGKIVGRYVRVLYGAEREHTDEIALDDKFDWLKDRVKLHGRWYDAGSGRNRLRELLSEHSGVPMLACDGDLDDIRLPFDDDSVDVASTFEVIEHTLNPLYVMREIHRIMKPGASLYLTTPDSYCPMFKAEHLLERKYRAHFHEFIETDLYWLLEKAGFKEVRVEKVTRDYRSRLLRLKMRWLYATAVK